MEDIEAVGHRCVHGGEEFFCSKLIDDQVIAQIKKCSDIAPLHNPANLLGINAVSKLFLQYRRLPYLTQLSIRLCLHTHICMHFRMNIMTNTVSADMVSTVQAINTCRRKVRNSQDLTSTNSKIITCHLGNGSSVTAVANGKSIDTSMGFTPLEGVIMGTRCGCVDPDVVTYLQEKEGLSAAEMSRVLNKKSGFLGLSCVSSDARDLNDAANAGDAKAKLTLKKLVYDVTKYIGAYAAVMNGVDLIVFTGGIGENNSRMRRRVCENLTYLGVKFDYEANVATGRMLLSLCLIQR